MTDAYQDLSSTTRKYSLSVREPVYNASPHTCSYKTIEKDANLPPPSTTALPKQNPSRGYILLLFGALFNALAAVMFSLASSRYNVTAATTSFATGIAVSFGALTYLCLTSNVRLLISRLSRNDVFLLGMRGGMGASSLALLLAALACMPAGDVDAIYYLSPVVTLGAARFILREPGSITDLPAALLAALGAALVSSPSAADSMTSAASRPLGVVLAFCSAVFSGFVYVVLRAAGTLPPMLIVTSLGMSAALLGLLLSSGNAPVAMFNNRQGAYVALLGGFSTLLGQGFQSAGFAHVAAAKGAVICTLEVPFVYALAMMVMGDEPVVKRVLGALCVVGGAVIVALSQMTSSSS